MRFRAGIDNVSTFYKIVQAVEKLQRACVVKFTETDMHIICAEESSEPSVQVWSQIKVPSLFSEYRIQSNADNQITLRLSTEALLSALRSAAAPSTSSTNAAAQNTDVVMKLAKKNDQAVLSFEISGLSRNGRYIRVTHDVRIEVMKPQDVQKLSEPMCPEPDVHILLPQLAKLRIVVERLRSLSQVIAVRANKSGRLQLSVMTDAVNTDVTWTGLNNPTMAKEGGTQEDQMSQASQAQNVTKMFGTLISVKSFVKFLSSHVVSTTTIACICQNHCIILYVYIGEIADAGGVLTFYIPAIVDERL